MFGWADVPAPPCMSDFDRDTHEEEPVPEATDPDRSSSSGRESWWDLDDWGDED